VRELENLMRRLAALSRDEVIGAGEIVAMLGSAPAIETAAGDAGIEAAVLARVAALGRSNPGALDDGTVYERIIAEVERPLIRALLARHGGNQLRAAKALGINRNTLRKRLDDLDIGGETLRQGRAGVRSLT
jgi:two-component system nitrogen regulation response regulator GlnG